MVPSLTTVPSYTSKMANTIGFWLWRFKVPQLSMVREAPIFTWTPKMVTDPEILGLLGVELMTTKSSSEGSPPDQLAVLCQSELTVPVQVCAWAEKASEPSAKKKHRFLRKLYV